MIIQEVEKAYEEWRSIGSTSNRIKKTKIELQGWIDKSNGIRKMKISMTRVHEDCKTEIEFDEIRSESLIFRIVENQMKQGFVLFYKISAII